MIKNVRLAGKKLIGINKITPVLSAVSLMLFAVVCILFLTSCNGTANISISRLLDFNTVLKGVRVSGIDLSGMTNNQALSATEGIPEALLGDVTVSIDVNGDLFRYNASELGIDTDYEEVIAQALVYGRTGVFEERLSAAQAASSEFIDYEVKLRAREDKIRESLQKIKQEVDKLPVDAAFVFTPSGHTADGSSIKAGGGSKPIRSADEGMPNPLRYQYYRTNKYVKNFIPQDANISRFYYSQEREGISVDIEALTRQIISAVETGDFSITAKVQILDPAVFTDNVKSTTQLISSWTSSYESHDNADRNYNVAKLSGIINGVIIDPGETWSINEEAGARTYDNGWKGAAGIVKGAYIEEPGGGVCQVSSTVYNAAIRAGLDIKESSRHSIISNYIPLGLDATISTGGKDLKLRNPYDTPVFIVSYVNTKQKNITVEIYGPAVIDAVHGQVILDFSSKAIEHTDMPKTEKHYRAAQTPDGKPIDPGASRLYVKARRGTTVQVYIHYISLDGKELEMKKFYVAKYPKITGHEYINDAPPK